MRTVLGSSLDGERPRLVRHAFVLLLGATLGCNAITGAGEPEIVAGEGGGATLATSGATTDATTGPSSVTGAGGGGAASGAGGDDVDPGPGDLPPCGDGAHDPDLEECDDGNATAGDGCSDTCRLECSTLETPRIETETCVFLSPGDDDRSWEDGQGACQERGGDLLVLHTLDLSLLQGRLGEEPAHVGASRAEDGAFEWIDGETVDEAAILDEDAGDCLAVGPLDLDAGEWLLLAVPCSERLRFLCEHDPTSPAE